MLLLADVEMQQQADDSDWLKIFYYSKPGSMNGQDHCSHSPKERTHSDFAQMVDCLHRNPLNGQYTGYMCACVVVCVQGWENNKLVVLIYEKATNKTAIIYLFILFTQ